MNKPNSSSTLNCYRRGKDELLRVTIQRFLGGSQKRTRKDDEIFGNWWKTHYGDIPIRQLTPAVLEEAKCYLEQTGYTKGKGEKKIHCSYAPQTILHYMKFLRHVLNIAVRDGKLDRNPFAQVKLPRVHQGKDQVPETRREEARLLAQLGPVYGPWARLAILTGMRKGETILITLAGCGLRPWGYYPPRHEIRTCAIRPPE